MAKKNIPDFYTWAKQQGIDPEEYENEPDVEDYWRQQYDVTFNRNLKGKNYHVSVKYTNGTTKDVDMGYFYEDAEDYVDELSKDPNVESIRLVLNKTGKLQNVYNKETGWKKPLHSFILYDDDIEESLNETLSGLKSKKKLDILKELKKNPNYKEDPRWKEFEDELINFYRVDPSEADIDTAIYYTETDWIDAQHQMESLEESVSNARDLLITNARRYRNKGLSLEDTINRLEQYVQKNVKNPGTWGCSAEDFINAWEQFKQKIRQSDPSKYYVVMLNQYNTDRYRDTPTTAEDVSQPWSFYDIIDTCDSFEDAKQSIKELSDIDSDYEEEDDTDYNYMIINNGKIVLETSHGMLVDESLNEDTVKQNGKWVNKGKEGTHGKFRLKKDADRQRRAMFRNGYHESLDEAKGRKFKVTGTLRNIWHDDDGNEVDREEWEETHTYTIDSNDLPPKDLAKVKFEDGVTRYWNKRVRHDDGSEFEVEVTSVEPLDESLDEAIKPLSNYSSYKLAKLLTDKYYDLTMGYEDKTPFLNWFDRNFGANNRSDAANIISNFDISNEKRINRDDLFYVMKYVDRVANLLLNTNESLTEAEEPKDIYTVFVSQKSRFSSRPTERKFKMYATSTKDAWHAMKDGSSHGLPWVIQYGDKITYVKKGEEPDAEWFIEEGRCPEEELQSYLDSRFKPRGSKEKEEIPPMPDKSNELELLDWINKKRGTLGPEDKDEIDYLNKLEDNAKQMLDLRAKARLSGRKNESLDEAKTEYKGFRRPNFDLITELRRTLGLDNYNDRSWKLTTDDGENFVISKAWSVRNEVKDFYDRIGPTLKSLGAKKISKFGNNSYARESGIKFFLSKENQDKILSAFNSEWDNKEAEYRAAISQHDVSKYIPDEKTLNRLRDVRDKGSKINAKLIKSLDKALTYLAASAMLDMPLWDLIDAARNLGADDSLINAVIESAEKQESDSRGDVEIKLNLPKSDLFTFDGKSCWLPKPLFLFFIKNNIPVHFLKRTAGDKYDRNGNQWSEIEHLVMFPGTDKEMKYDIVVHTLESGGKNSYKGNGTPARVGIDKVISDIKNQLNRKGVQVQESLNEAKNDTLNPAIWENDELKPEVKEKLQFIADKFIEKLEEDDIPLDVDDIVIVGSNRNYNYGPQSDIDLHIIADLSQFKGREKELAEKIYQRKKSIFNDKYDPTINGFEVEIYVEPAEDKNDNDIPDEVEEPLEEQFKKPSKDVIEQMYDMITSFEGEISGVELGEFARKFNLENVEAAEKVIDCIKGGSDTLDNGDPWWSLIREEIMEDKDLEEGLVQLSEEDIKHFESQLDELGFDIEGKGRTTFGNLHYQVILRGDHLTEQDLRRAAKRLNLLSDKMDDLGIPMTYNVGMTYDDEITAGLDLHKKYVKEEESLEEDVPDYAYGYNDAFDKAHEMDYYGYEDEHFEEIPCPCHEDEFLVWTGTQGKSDEFKCPVCGKYYYRKEGSDKLTTDYEESLTESAHDEIDQIYDFLSNEGLSWFDVRQGENGTVIVCITWGDWKHEHLRCNRLMMQIGYGLEDEEVTDEDGSDTYSSNHIYKCYVPGLLKHYVGESLNEGAYTRKELIDKFGTDDLDLINAGREENVELKDESLTEGANGSVEDYLKQMKKTGNPEKVMKNAKGNPNAEKAYKQFKGIKDESLKEDLDSDIDDFYSEFDPSGDHESGFVAYDYDELNNWITWLDSRGLSYDVNEIDDTDDGLYGEAVAYLTINESLTESEDEDFEDEKPYVVYDDDLENDYSFETAEEAIECAKKLLADGKTEHASVYYKWSNPSDPYSDTFSQLMWDESDLDEPTYDELMAYAHSDDQD